jgi:peptidoglycan/LPS O-acetylase OafA/YrhL
MTSDQPPEGGYRPDVDGLRAIAVVAVVLYHVSKSLLPGGFLGVDVFFVISGFLITRNIVLDVDRGRFSIREFYRRRVKRIAPAMLLIVGVTLVASQLLQLPEDAHDTARSSVFSIFSLSNVYFWRYLDSGYFAASSAQVPLLHLWSLGVEEQFYLFWPTTLLLLYRPTSSKLRLAIILVGVAAVSFALGEFSYPKDPSFAYYMLPTRAGELLLGAISALVLLHQGTRRWPARLALALSTTGMVVLGVSLAAISESQPFPGWRAAVPTAATTLVILAGHGQGHVWSRLLSSKGAVWTGLVSYSAYLWHWPLLALYRYGYGEPGPVPGATMGILTFLLAWLSYRYVEQPARRSKASLPRVVTRQFLLPAGALFTLAMVMMYGPRLGIPLHSGRYQAQLSAARNATRPAYDVDWACQRQLVTSADLSDPLCIVGPASKDPPTVLVWGDSHAAHYLGVLRAFANGAGFRFRNVEVGSCPPLLVDPAPFVEARRLADCRASLAVIQNAVEQYPVVILSSASLNYGPDYLGGFRGTVSHLAAEGKIVVILGEVPGVPGYDRRCREKGLTYPFLTCPHIALPLSARVADNNQALRAMAEGIPGARYFDANTYLCPAGLCTAYWPSGEPIYYDETHLSLEASLRLGQEILSREGVPPPFKFPRPPGAPRN